MGFPDSTNPWFSYGPPDTLVVDALWGSPVVTCPTATLLPDELTEIPTQANGDVSKDGLTVTMHLRPDLKWSDGQPLTAEDFHYWLEVVQNPAYYPCYYGFDQIAHAEVQNDQTLKLHYKRPFAFSVLYLPPAAPKHLWGSIPPPGPGKPGRCQPVPSSDQWTV